LVTFGGSSVFSAASVPSGSTQVPIFSGSGNAQVISLVFNSA
jgi:ribonuclease T2